MNISGLIIAHNEEDNIEACIESLQQVCPEVVVVDSHSTDKTAERACPAGGQVYFQSFLGDGPQRNHGLRHCTHDWALNLDADERL